MVARGSFGFLGPTSVDKAGLEPTIEPQTYPLSNLGNSLLLYYMYDLVGIRLHLPRIFTHVGLWQN